jgi:Ca-activated chloride channel family protein
MSDFTFLEPARLVLLALPFVLAVSYLVARSRRRRFVLRFTTLDLLDEVAPDRPGWRRHLPAVAMLAGTVVAALAVARPAVARSDGEAQRIVVLAIDTSLSMEATDVSPSRVEAAKVAAGDFLDSVPDNVAVGVVGFDGRARQLISPTTRLEAVRRTIDRAQLGEGTAIGDAVLLALDAIDSAAAPVVADRSAAGAGPDASRGTIVLLSDGETTEGRPNDEASAEARAQGIAVNTIAFGTDGGTISDPIAGVVNVPVNREALRQLAAETDGRALTADTAEELSQVYEDLGRSVEVDVERREVTDWFAAAALALLMVASAGSLVWFGRLP